MTTRGRLSPIAPTPRSTSPASASSRTGNVNVAGPAISGHSLPRASVSSVRSGSSLKKSPADFEAALLNPNTTFLSGGPDLAGDGSTPAPAGGAPEMEDDDAPVPLEKRSYEEDLRAIGRTDERGQADDGEHGHEHDTLEGPGRVGVIPPTPKRSAMPGRSIAGPDAAVDTDVKPTLGLNFAMSTPKKDQRGSIASQGASVSVEGKVMDRRTSHATMASQDSYGSPSRMSMISASSSVRQSMGLDAELNESQKMGKPKAKLTKRRSMFRSPGTASSPDLATLVRKAKEAKASASPTAPPTALPPKASPNGSPVARHTRHAPPPPHMTSSQSVGLGLGAALGSGSRVASNPAPGLGQLAAAHSGSQGRIGPVKSASRGSEDWDRFSDLKSLGSASPEKMTTIAERPASHRSRESSHDGSKSLRSKAKGVFGRMFGGSSSREHTPTTSPTLPSAARFNTPDHAQPPVPPVPVSYRREADIRRNAKSPTLGATRSMTSPQLVNSPQISDTQDITPTMMQKDGRFDTSIDHGLRSATPTGRRDGAISTSTGSDKPLPPIQPSPGATPLQSFSHSRDPDLGTGTLHRRQPAAHGDDGDDGVLDEDSPSQIGLIQPSPRQPVTMSFSDDVAGIFDAIGQSEPAKELGLPPDSMRIRERAHSADVAMSNGAGGGKTRFPTDLGRSSTDTPRRGSQGKLGVPQPSVTTRTSSLPTNGSPRPGTAGAAMLSQRTTSSPTPAPQVALFVPTKTGDEGGAREMSLIPPSRTVSRSSSTSSRRRTRTDNGAYPSLVPPPNLGSPLLVQASDFGHSVPSPSAGGEGEMDPEEARGSDTIKLRKEAEPLPPLSPASVRLVTTPSLETPRKGLSVTTEGLLRSNLIGASAWGRQSPSPRSSSRTTDSIEIVHTPTTPRRVNGAPTAEDDEEKGRRLACEFLDDDFSSVQADKVAEFLGGPRLVNGAALRSYMSYFDMKGQTLVEAFRDLCAKLHLKAESQEIDRILEGFSARYYDCNPTTVFGTPGVVHTVTAAMLMLNTDLHIADLQKHMSRADFVRNAMRAIQESMPSDRGSTPDLVRDDSGSVRLGSSSVSSIPTSGGQNENANGNSATVRHRPGPSSISTAPRSASAPVVASPHPPTRVDSERSFSGLAGGSIADRARTSAPTPAGSAIYGKAWEGEAENALKDIFNQVRADKILLPIGNNSSSTPSSQRQSVISLNSDSRGTMLRSPSGRSNDRISAIKRGSIRGMQGLMNHPYNSVFSTSDGRLGPTPSYATSVNDATAPATIGFASNLSHTVIKEQEDEKDSVASAVSQDTSDEDLDDDELALLGAPWAKEGLLSRRVGTEVATKKVGKKDWKQFFVVVQKGEMLLFTFGEGSGSASFGVVGGGNWLNNANTAGRYSLTHTQATTVKGGYSRDRPYVFCLSLPSGEAVYLAAGTDDLVTEWVNTCNYWSARQSRQPLQGGVGNIEYGWSRVADSHHRRDSASALGTSLDDDRASIRSSSSKMSKFNTATYGRRSFSATPGDRVFINDWKAPPPSLVHSQLEEEAQYEVLRAYHHTLGEELEAHRALEEPMMRLFTQNSKNAQKAHVNWANKTKYLVAELNKYRTYRDTLQEAIELRVKKQGERKLEKSLARSMTSLHRRESADIYRSDDEARDVEDEEDDTWRYQATQGQRDEEGHSADMDGAATPVATRASH